MACHGADKGWPPLDPDYGSDAGWGSDPGSDADDQLESIPEEEAEQDLGPGASTQAQGSRSHSAMVPKAALPRYIDKDLNVLQREISFELERAMPGFISAVRWGGHLCHSGAISVSVA